MLNFTGGLRVAVWFDIFFPSVFLSLDHFLRDTPLGQAPEYYHLAGASQRRMRKEKMGFLAYSWSSLYFPAVVESSLLYRARAFIKP